MDIIIGTSAAHHGHVFVFVYHLQIYFMSAIFKEGRRCTGAVVSGQEYIKGVVTFNQTAEMVITILAGYILPVISTVQLNNCHPHRNTGNRMFDRTVNDNFRSGYESRLIDLLG
ncbi:hypothetical protein BMS3Bbin04_00735 [bacterium BMS3Bbin04]|nr:hypothetical protein BMS3Bbin04_00735 [bacterium BMS3Bbin04]